MLISGVDPGKGGAVSLHDTTRGTCAVVDLPLTHEGRKTVIDPVALSILWRAAKPDLIALEHVGYVAGDGGLGAFQFGDVFGTIKGVAGALGLRVQLVRPQVWKRTLGLIGKSKVASYRLAKRLYPCVAESLRGPRGGLKIDRAEAVLIGHYAVATVGER